MGTEECVKEVLSHYLGCNQHEINSSPFKWWKCHNKDVYISMLAQRYLSVCATSSPSERVFSTSGKFTDKCNCLKPDKVDKLVFYVNQ